MQATTHEFLQDLRYLILTTAIAVDDDARDVEQLEASMTALSDLSAREVLGRLKWHLEHQVRTLRVIENKLALAIAADGIPDPSAAAKVYTLPHCLN